MAFTLTCTPFKTETDENRRQQNIRRIERQDKGVTALSVNRQRAMDMWNKTVSHGTRPCRTREKLNGD